MLVDTNHRKILIVGDSFAAPIVSTIQLWYQKVNQHHRVVNKAQAGVGQYKIHLQLISASLQDFDLVVMAITSPYRLHIETNPFYRLHTSHEHCDLLYKDIKSRLPDPDAERIVWWFENCVDLKYSEFIHNLVVNESLAYCTSKHIPCIPFSFFPNRHLTCNILNLQTIWKKHPGKFNHLSPLGHELFADRILDCIGMHRDVS